MTSPTTVEVLQKARALLEKGWCQHHFSTGKSGRYVNPLGKSALCFCIDGALMRATGCSLSFGPSRAAVGRALPGSVNFLFWNDAPGRTQSEVLDLMDRAIALASEKEAGHVG